MASTKQIPRDQWKNYFDAFTKKHLRDDLPESVTVELVSPELGGQVQAEGARLRGISYDPKNGALEVYLDKVDARAHNPKEIWVEEDDDGFLPSVEIVRGDGTKEILTIRRRYPLTPK